MTTYGNRVESPAAFDRLGPNNNNQKASVQSGAVTVAGRIVRLGGWVEKKANDSRIAFGVWNVDANGKPTTLVARTDRFEPPGTGRVVTYPVRNQVSVGVGRRLAFGFMVSAGDVRVGKSAAAATVYRRDAGDVSDFGANPAVDATHVAAWAIFAEADDVPPTDPPTWDDPIIQPPRPPDGPDEPAQPDPVPTDPFPPYVPGPAAAPYPSGLVPAIGETFSSLTLPTFSWDAFDTGGRTIACRLHVQQLGAGTSRYLDASAPATGTRWSAAGTAALIPAPGLYEWWVEVSVPSVAGLKTSLSQRMLVSWTPPLTVTVVSPAENAAVATVAPETAWTVADGAQVRWRARLYDAATAVQLRETDWIGSPVAAWRLPVEWGVRNGGRYGIEVEVDGGGGAAGVSPRRTFRVSYTPPATLANVAVTATAMPGDAEASTAKLTWNQTALSSSEFAGYVVRRAWGGGAEIAVAHITNPGQLQFIDAACPVNVAVTWRVSQLRIASGVVTESEGGTVTATVPLTVPTLSSVYDGYTRRVSALWLGDGLGGSFVRPETGVVTWGSGGRPTLISTPASYGTSTLSVSVTARTDAYATLRQRAEAMQALVESGDPVVWRGEWERYFCRIASWSWEREGVGQRTMSLELEEIAFDEGIAVTVPQ